MNVLRGVLVLLAAFVCLGGRAAAHEVRPAYLQITQVGPQRYEVFWKQPAQNELVLRLAPHLSNGWLERQPDAVMAEPSHLAKRWLVEDPFGPLGATVSVDGLDATMTDVIVRASLEDGREFQAILRRDAPSATIAFASHASVAVGAYYRLGVEHILTGIDHLAFVLGLMLLVGFRPALIKAITAFTVAHSLTLGAAALGLVKAPAATIEALVALSILALATELSLARRGKTGLTQRNPWIVAFTFGLLHGLAFAGALRETGLPPHAVPLALLLFNLGVEAGQLIFVTAAGLTLLGLRTLARGLQLQPGGLAGKLPEYGLGAFAAYWLIERTALIFV